MPQSTTLTTYIGADDVDLLDELRRRARAGDRTLSAQVKRTLRAGLPNDERPAATPGAVTTSAGGVGRDGVEA